MTVPVPRKWNAPRPDHIRATRAEEPAFRAEQEPGHRPDTRGVVKARRAADCGERATADESPLRATAVAQNGQQRAPGELAIGIGLYGVCVTRSGARSHATGGAEACGLPPPTAGQAPGLDTMPGWIATSRTSSSSARRSRWDPSGGTWPPPMPAG